MKYQTYILGKIRKILQNVVAEIFTHHAKGILLSILSVKKWPYGAKLNCWQLHFNSVLLAYFYVKISLIWSQFHYF